MLQKDWDVEGKFTPFYKMIVIVPKSGYKHANLSDYDNCIKGVAHTTKVSSNGQPLPIKLQSHKMMAGHPEKDYSSPLFQATVDGEVCL